MAAPTALDALLARARACDLCRDHLPLGPRPVVAAAEDARVVIIGQAPGRRVHASGTPWDDPSGARLRAWLGVDTDTFYDARRFAILPMGFCYPGAGRSGDLPPRPECAPTWHAPILAHLRQVELTVLISRYAIDSYLRGRTGASLTATVRAYRDYLPSVIPLPHPSPRNNRWFAKNPWFEEEVLPALRARVRECLA